MSDDETLFETEEGVTSGASTRIQPFFFFSYLPYLTESLGLSAEIETRDTVLARSPLPITAHLCPSSHPQEVLGMYMGLWLASLC